MRSFIFAFVMIVLAVLFLLWRYLNITKEDPVIIEQDEPLVEIVPEVEPAQHPTTLIKHIADGEPTVSDSKLLFSLPLPDDN